MKTIRILLFLLLSSTVFGQVKSCAEIEKELFDIASKVRVNREKNLDSLDYYSLLFGNKMLQYIKGNPETLKHPFKSLVDGHFCFVTTSPDKALRIYSWDTELGGTMVQFSSIRQYQTNAGIFCDSSIQNLEVDDTTDLNPDEDDSYDPGTFCSAIYRLKSVNKTYYLAIKNGIYSTKDSSQAVECYTIENDKLIDANNLIKTSKGMTNKIYVSFDFFTVVDRPERPLELIKFDEKKKIIYIPIVYENGKVTEKFITYKFNGIYFERVPKHK